MKDWMLTEREILKTGDGWHGLDIEQRVAQAQHEKTLRKLIEMIEEKWGDATGIQITLKDWQSLSKEAGLGGK